MKVLNLSVREIIEFLYSTGDLASSVYVKNRALEGTELHSYLQSLYKEEDEKEVFVTLNFQEDEYDFHISGRIDGVLKEGSKVILEEIKSTRKPLELINIDTNKQHLMQVKMYGYMYMKKHDLKSISVRLTYIEVESKEVKSFNKRYNFKQLEKFFYSVISDYISWQLVYDLHQDNKLKSIEGIEFPFDEFRDGQYEFMGAVYQNLVRKDILYAEAPTGIGKTVGALYAGLKTISNEREKLFFLTAKNAGKKVVVDTIRLLKQKGLVSKSVVVNSKESMCLMDKVDCNPEICPYAKGYFDRLRDALNDVFESEDVYDSDIVNKYALVHDICPYEFSLSISNYSDIVICDYNFAFDPVAHLIRYFEEDNYDPKLLVDEAHNLVSRSRSMFSASISEETIVDLSDSSMGLNKKLLKLCDKLINYLDDRKEEFELEKNSFFHQKEVDSKLILLTERLKLEVDKLLSDHLNFSGRKDVLKAHFELIRFLRIKEFYNEEYNFLYEYKNEFMTYTVKCLDASGFINDVLKERSFGSVFFSATLSPIDYFSTLITSGKGASMAVDSPFDNKNLGLFIDGNTSTRYKDRPSSVSNILDHIYAVVEGRVGNYIVFFPSYKYLRMVLEEFDEDLYDVYIQTPKMTRLERKELLDGFTEESTTTKVAFFVLGGSFSEGIDLVGEQLSGVVVVGVSLPAFSNENEMLKSHFDEKFDQGFDYAYTYPGMNKVIQAVGRVIRTESDKGVAVLIDDRYKYKKYKDLFPKHWNHVKFIGKNEFLADYIDDFWKDKK